jgi:AraC family transcriptional regulator
MFKRRVKAIEIASMTVAGLEIVTKSILSPDSKDENYLLPELWGDFWSVFPKLGVKTSGMSFGITTPFENDSSEGKIKYLAGVEFKRGVPPGLDFKTIVIPAGKYVRYTHKGSMDTIKESYITAYTNWFPSLNLKMRNAPHIELYDERFNPASPKCAMDILIPIK